MQTTQNPTAGPTTSTVLRLIDYPSNPYGPFWTSQPAR